MKINVLLRKLKTFIKTPKILIIKILYIFSPWMGDRIYLKLLFPLKVGYWLNLKDPKTFNQKLQWLKLNYRRPEFTTMVDKYEVKQYVKGLIGEEYIIENYGVWNSFSSIDFDRLPSKFVLKTTHDQGGVIICRDKALFDFNSAEAKLKKHLKRKHYYLSREWPYKAVKPRIIAEKYIAAYENEYEVSDYKFFCFDGVPKLLYIASERQNKHVKFDFFDMNFNYLDIKQSYEQSGKYITKPEGFQHMVDLAKILSSGYPHIRVDFYNIRGKIFFGELTLFHHGGLVPFFPMKWDYRLGDWLHLPI